ncbi:hypothetical protein [Massilia sp. CF038]|uniref:hypothetical protein n=1 Tax=Massilia sp. CF038 TaxID=1881045 RepID=UPI00090F05D7|nr:hypothetical protein [Massilia sp. CF038]SHH54593.1 hypothetical protein SAMN05428948_4390 [Massilia sp. CF038]
MKKIGCIAASLALITTGATALPIGGGSFTVQATFAPTAVVAGQSATFTWSSPIGAYCDVDGLPGGARGGRTGSYTFVATENVHAQVSCERADVFAGKSASLIVTSANVPTVTTGFNPSTVYVNTGGSNFSWNATNATSCYSPNFGGLGTSGTIWVGAAPSASQFTATITCSGPYGSASSSAVLSTIVQPTNQLPTVNVTASPSFLSRPGLFTNISYSATNYTSCTGAGRFRVFESTSFDVTCTGPGGTATNFAWVEVAGDGTIPRFAPASSASLDDKPLAIKRAGVPDLRNLGIDLSKKRYAFVESDFNKDGARDVLVYDKLSSKLHVVMAKDGKYPALSRSIDNVRAINQVKSVTVPASNAAAEIRVTLESQQ